MAIKERGRLLTPDELTIVESSIRNPHISPKFNNPDVLDFLDQIRNVGEAVRRAERILVVTGAGISAESKIPTFRSIGGWWRSHDPEQLATRAAFAENPRKVWEWYDHRRALIAGAEPNLAHKTLAAWEQEGKQVSIITQNVDDLHERAGNSGVIHIHGSIWQVQCMEDGRTYEDRRVPLPQVPPLCSCGGLLRPKVVWFDEELPVAECERIEDLFKHGKFEVALVIGTEATFDYVQEYALDAQRSGALLVEINLKSTTLTDSVDVHLTGKAGEVLPLLR